MKNIKRKSSRKARKDTKEERILLDFFASVCVAIVDSGLLERINLYALNAQKKENGN